MALYSSPVLILVFQGPGVNTKPSTTHADLSPMHLWGLFGVRETGREASRSFAHTVEFRLQQEQALCFKGPPSRWLMDLCNRHPIKQQGAAEGTAQSAQE